MQYKLATFGRGRDKQKRKSRINPYLLTAGTALLGTGLIFGAKKLRLANEFKDMKKVDLSNVTKPSNISDELKDKFDKVQFKVKDPLKELQRNQELSARGNLSARGVKGKQAKSDIIKRRQAELRQQFNKDNARYDFDLRVDKNSEDGVKQIYRNRLKKLVNSPIKDSKLSKSSKRKVSKVVNNLVTKVRSNRPMTMADYSFN
jgi:hypothetical protein